MIKDDLAYNRSSVDFVELGSDMEFRLLRKA